LIWVKVLAKHFFFDYVKKLSRTKYISVRSVYRFREKKELLSLRFNEGTP